MIIHPRTFKYTKCMKHRKLKIYGNSSYLFSLFRLVEQVRSIEQKVKNNCLYNSVIKSIKSSLLFVQTSHNHTFYHRLKAPHMSTFTYIVLFRFFKMCFYLYKSVAMAAKSRVSLYLRFVAKLRREGELQGPNPITQDGNVTRVQTESMQQTNND